MHLSNLGMHLNKCGTQDIQNGSLGTVTGRSLHVRFRYSLFNLSHNPFGSQLHFSELGTHLSECEDICTEARLSVGVNGQSFNTNSSYPRQGYTTGHIRQGQAQTLIAVLLLASQTLYWSNGTPPHEFVKGDNWVIRTGASSLNPHPVIKG